MNIGIDIMGGDFAPVETIKGAVLASGHIGDDDKIVLIGDKNVISEELKKYDIDSEKFEIVHAQSVIKMSEHPSKAFQTKQDSSIVVGFKLLASRKIDGFCGLGNTGAMLVGALYIIKQIPGIIRPVISTPMPRLDGTYGLLLDVGLNADCKPDVLYQYAMLGNLYAKHILKIDNPKVALLNIGSESEKGNMLTKTTYELMKVSPDFNFIGNIEGNQIFENHADVIVCDGFTGNVVLKEAEGIYNLMKKRNIKDDYFDKFNFENYGATPILGINSNVTIGHGRSMANAVKTGILNTREVIKVNLSKIIKEAFQ